MVDTPSATVAGASDETRVRGALDGWKRKLLDLTKRNRALNFKVTKVSTIEITDERPAEVFRRLYLEEKAMRFKATPEEVETSAPRISAPLQLGFSQREQLDLGKDASGLGTDFTPYGPSSLDERHRDDYLQTTLSSERLDHSLVRIDEQARSTLEEQGVHTLFLALGVLNYRESPDSVEMFAAPLVLLPVTLDRKSARAGFSVRLADEDPIVNPTLREYLKRDFGIALPDLPPLDSIPETYDLQTLFATIHDAIGVQKGWRIKTDVFLTPLSFQKFAMYKDLEVNGDSFVAHRLIRRVVTRSGRHVIGLPEEIRTMDLDEECPPESSFQVVDSDSSQGRALAAAARGYDLVIEGPPGTGKSQTITNLIAQALAVDKSVLFVAEKMAALEVVHERLVRAGLGEFCLELHSTKANKRRVMQDLAAALDASLQGVAASTASTQRLPPLRRTLDDYVEALHAQHGTFACSPFRAYGELSTVLAAPRVAWSHSVEITRHAFDEIVRDLTDLATQAKWIGNPLIHPWRDATVTFYSPTDLEAIGDLTQSVLQDLADLKALFDQLEQTLGLPPIRAFADLEVAAVIADALNRSTSAPLAVLNSDLWNVPPPHATQLVGELRELHEARTYVDFRFQLSVLGQRHDDDIAFVEAKRRGPFGFLAFLNGRYRAICRRWKELRLPSYQPSVLEEAHDLKRVDDLSDRRRTLAGKHLQAEELFGRLWNGEQSDSDALDRYVAWVVEFRSLCVRHAIRARAIELASRGKPNVSAVATARESATKIQAQLSRLEENVGWRLGYLVDRPLAEIVDRLGALIQRLRDGAQWAGFEAARQTVANGPAADLLDVAFSGQIPFIDLPAAFRRSFLMKWLSSVVAARPPLAKFATMTHEERIAEFRDLDSRVLLENRAALVGRLRDRVQHRLQEPDAVAALPFLRREMARQRNLKPLRKTLHETEPAMRAIKPCFLMSPLTVAQCLKAGPPSFDLVIFDEASQLPPEDAVGAIVRGSQLVVVGDPKQLPPTTFFTSGFSAEEAYSADGTPLYEDSESILEDFMGAGTPMARLKWHYRSTHESLITFSNVNFYDSDLYTFPSVDTGTEKNGLSFEYVEGGVYEGKGLNLAEARRVADEVVMFANVQLKAKESGSRTMSLGVGTFNLRQQLAIQDELEVRRRADSRLDPFFDRGVTEPFFVKNLENVQGDERDVIFISVTYAKGQDGKLRQNFGPLNGKNGWRRLNVLTTRARSKMRVFSSMRGEEISLAAASSDGPRLLREFLIYAERGHLESKLSVALADADSPLERDVITELTRRGVNAVPQVGVAGYRIDIGVLDDEVLGRFICGIECDGVAYHSSETARDRDRLRQQVLEGRGWKLLRVWSTDWFKDRSGQIERMMQFIDSARQTARDSTGQRVGALAEPDSPVDAPEPAFESLVVARPLTKEGYSRPVAAVYRFSHNGSPIRGGDISIASTASIATAISEVINTESPIHTDDLLSRVASMWGNRLGSLIQMKIARVLNGLLARGTVRRRGQFLWNLTDGCTLRSRAGTKIPADRIAPEELEQAITAVLSQGHSFPRQQLTNEVRSVFGFSRTGSLIDEAVGGAIDRMIASGRLGEASGGLSLKR
ncbi:MAG: DUF3320 domain-containing protein [Acidobacteriota bacterium]|nr:DUF3320 domain-containing protein [Acidobacteriota bacterium]